MSKVRSRPTLKFLKLVELLTTAPAGGLGFKQMCEELDISKATCSAILSSASSLGYVYKDPTTRKWTLGPRLAFLSQNLNRSADRSLSHEF